MLTVVSLLMLLGCGSSPIHNDYAEARSRALVDPGPAPENWQPDAILWIAGPTVDELVTLALRDQAALAEETEVQAGPTKGTVHPDVTLDKLTLRSTDRCASCLSARAELSGTLKYAFGPARGAVPVEIVADIDLTFVADALGNGAFDARFEPQGVRSLSLDLGKRGLPGALDRRVEAELQKRLEENLKTLPLGVLGEGAPLRAVRLHPSPHGLGIAMLTASPAVVALPWAAPKIRSGWEADLHSQAALGLARKASFEAGPQSGEIVVEPTTLHMEGRRFELTLRMWRLSGSGWWRDVKAVGTFSIQNGAITLKADEVTQIGASEGAAGSDPLAWIGEDLLLGVVQDALSTSVPRQREVRSDGWITQLAVGNVSGVQDRVTLRGTLQSIRVAPDARPKMAPAKLLDAPSPKRPQKVAPSPRR